MHFRSSTKIVSAVAFLTAMAFGTLHADAPTAPAELLKARHDHYRALGEANKVIRDLSRARNPDFAAIEKAAQQVVDATVDQGKWFPKGSGPEAGKTRALPEIWTKPAEFEAAQKMFADRAPALLTAAKAKDTSALQNALREVGASCKNCHDNFRGPENR